MSNSGPKTPTAAVPALGPLDEALRVANAIESQQ